VNEEKRKQLEADKKAEEVKLDKYVNGGKLGITVLHSLATMKSEVERLRTEKSQQLSAKEKGVATRNNQIKTSEEKIAKFDEELLKLASASSAASAADTFTLPPMQKRAVPQLHIYPEQDLPLPV
jgi:hypothetical protein